MLPFNAVVVLAALLTCSSSAQLSVVFPLNSQFPPVAVANEEFTFTFSPNTFSAQTSSLEYELKKGPSWLRLDGDIRTFSGIPSTADIGQVQIDLQASTKSATTVTSATLSVLEENTLSGDYEALTHELTTAGSFSPPSTLLLHPSSSFKINLANALFYGVNSDTIYYVLSAGNTPLPAWVSFNPNTLLFSGTTPTLLTPQASPQTYSFVIVASQVVGSSQASLSFDISVANHILAFDQPLQTVNLHANSTTFVPSLLNQLNRDDYPIAREAVKSISTNQPEWLVLNNSDFSFTGSPPHNINDTFFQVDVIDDQNNPASAIVWLLATAQSVGYQAETYLASVSCERGEEFEYKLPSFEAWRPSYNYAANLGNATSWLSFNTSSLKLSGVVPLEAPIGDVKISVSLLAGNNPVQINTLEVVITDSLAFRPSQTSQSGGGPTPSPISGGTSASSSATPFNHSKRYSKTLALAISLPLALVAVIAIIGYLWFTKSRKKHKRKSQNLAGSTSLTHGRGAVELVEGEPQPKLNTVSKNAIMSSKVELPWNSLAQSHREGLPATPKGIASNPEAMSSWDEILTDLELLTRIAGFGKPPKITQTDADDLKTKTGVRQALLLQTTSRKSGDSTSFRSGVTRKGNLESKDSGTQSTGRRSSGLGHGTFLPSAIEHDRKVALIPKQHQFEHETCIARPSASPTGNLDAYKRHVLTSSKNPSNTTVYEQTTSLMSTSSSHEDENSRTHQFRYFREWQQSATTSQMPSEGGVDCEWITETGTVSSDDEDLGQDACLRVGFRAERQGNRLAITSRQSQCPEGTDVDSQRSELSQTHSLRFL